jgi:hypothetical protein
MLEAGLDGTRCVESVCNVHHGAGVLRQLAPSVAVEVLIDGRGVGDGWEATSCVKYATQELFSEEKEV